MSERSKHRNLPSDSVRLLSSWYTVPIVSRHKQFTGWYQVHSDSAKSLVNQRTD